MNLIERDDPRYFFTETSNEPYDRHNYLIHFKNKMPQHRFLGNKFNLYGGIQMVVFFLM